MTRSRFLLAIVPSATVLALQTSCPSGGGKTVAPPAATGGAYAVNTALLTDYAQSLTAPLRQLFRLHLDVPISDTATWTALETALNMVQPDLNTAHNIVSGLVKGAIADTSRAARVINAALGPPYQVTHGVDRDNLMLVTDYTQPVTSARLRYLQVHIDVPIIASPDWRALHNALDSSPPNLAAAYPIVRDALKAASAGTTDEQRRALGVIAAALGPPY